jgi:predicted GNAT family acetyltransferase
MGWTLTGDLDEYAAAAEGFLRADAVRNTVPLAVLDTLRVRGLDAYGEEPPAFGWWHDGDAVAGILSHTPPYPLYLSQVPAEAVHEAVRLLAGRPSRPEGIHADQPVAEEFASAWTRVAGGTSRVEMRQRLYRLEGLRTPEPPPEGKPRLATEADRDLVLAWHEAFRRESGGVFGVGAIDDRIAHRGFVLWEAGGTTVSLAGRTRVVEGMARIGPVYTPPEHRRRGFGAMATAAVTEAALEAGARDVVLFTDLANPTSNGIYQELGYRPVTDRLVLAFEPPTESAEG